ncbi:MAG: Regulator of RpoS [Nitrosopumilus sp.]|nr:Regulator of RpoS [Nitrosopumilus sp.]
MKILIAEDEPEISEQYKLVLEHKGHTVKITEDGQLCIDEFDNDSQYDCVILDFKMPKKTGIEVAQYIFEKNANQRVIMASAYVNHSIEQQLSKLGKVTEILVKPFKINYMLKMLESADHVKFAAEINSSKGNTNEKVAKYESFLNTHMQQSE